MSGYAEFSSFYDRFTGDVDYSARARYFDTLIQKYSPGANLLLDLACGTGSLSFELEKLGYDVIGVDDSCEMLGKATEKRTEMDSRVLLLCQGMADLDLYGTVDASVCALDSLNHILDEDELLRVFKKVSLFSNPGAVFIFDVNTLHKHRDVLGDNSFVFEDEEAMCVWRNSFDDQSGRVDIALDFFSFIPESGLWNRVSTEFSEAAYSTDMLTQLADKAGFDVRGVFDKDSFLPPQEDSDRLIFVLVKRMNRLQSAVPVAAALDTASCFYCTESPA